HDWALIFTAFYVYRPLKHGVAMDIFLVQWGKSLENCVHNHILIGKKHVQSINRRANGAHQPI
ncbi:TPA: hypothetical protein ACMDS0_003472, partial [Vibrio cholerae]